MFVTGLVFGIFIGVFFGALVAGLCAAAARGAGVWDDPRNSSAMPAAQRWRAPRPAVFKASLV
jgi:hypothetical protein